MRDLLKAVLVTICATLFGYLANAADCQVADWTWSISRYKRLEIEGVAQNMNVKLIYAKLYDDEKYIGNSAGVVNPGGSFLIMDESLPSGKELKVIFDCQ